MAPTENPLTPRFFEPPDETLHSNGEPSLPPLEFDREKELTASTARLRARRKYHTLMELGRGGAAVVSAALSTGECGFRKLVVLKTAKEGFCEQAGASDSFMHEARLAARMSHPNIVHTYEAYYEDDQPVIVMEYLDGVSLARGRRFFTGDPEFVLRATVSVLHEVLSGLHYAHSLRDFDGTPHAVVHRDVSPQNVMLTYDGQVKLVDFGIAKLVAKAELAAKRERVEVGALKGKLCYMPPEQVRGAAVDARVDVFAVGVMLWEAVARRRMWGNLRASAILTRLMNGDLPRLEEAAVGAPPALLGICRKATAADPAARFQSAEEMREALLAYLRESGGLVTPTELGRWVASSCAPLRQGNQDRLRAALSTLSDPDDADLDIDVEALDGEEVGVGAVDEAPPVPRPSAPSRPGPAPVRDTHMGCERSIVPTLPAREPRRATPLWAVALLTASVAALPWAVVLLARGDAPSSPAALGAGVPAQVRLSISTSPASAKLFLDGEPLGESPFEGTLRTGGAPHELRAEAEGHRPVTHVLSVSSDTRVRFTLEPLP